MTESTIPPELIRSLKKQEVSLWLGPRVFSDAGCPGLEELMTQIKRAFDVGPELDRSEKGLLEAYLTRHEWTRAAKFFHDKDVSRFHHALRQAYRLNNLQSPFEPPYYLRILQNFGFHRVLVPDFAAFPETLFPDHELLTWQDTERLGTIEDAPCLVHTHGTAQRPDSLVLTLDNEKVFQGERGDAIRVFVRQTLLVGPALMVGFPADDPVIEWLGSLLVEEDRPQAYRLQRAEEIGARPTWLSELPIDSRMDTGTVLRGLDGWCADLARQLEINFPAAPAPPKSGKPDWTSLTYAGLVSLPVPNREKIEGYYNGEQPAWSLIRDGYTIDRTATGQVLELIEKGSRAVLVTAASCEGKTTVLKQAAMALMQKGSKLIEVHHSRSHVLGILEKESGPLVIMLDQAVHFYGLAKIIHAAQQRREPTALLLAARTHEWEHAHGQAEILIRDLPKVTIKGLNKTEAKALVAKLRENGMLKSSDDHQAIVARLLNKGKGVQHQFLLAAMLEITRGKPFAEILKEVVEEICGWLDGKILIKALGIAVIIESLPTKSGTPFSCSQALFREMLGTVSVETISQRLKGEVQLRTEGNKIATRDPQIAKTLFPILFESKLLDLNGLCEDLLWAAGRLAYDPRNSFERSLLTIIPNSFIRKNEIAKAEELLATATKAEPGHAPTWQVWARLMAKKDTIGERDQPGTARYLFHRATEADPSHAPAWQAWAVMEGGAENIGEIEKEWSARWLFKRATEVDPADVPSWQAWAVMEGEANNIGEIEEEWSARWLFQRATETNPNDPASWHAWAQMEMRLGNKQRALELVKKGLASAPNDRWLTSLRAEIRKIDSTITPSSDNRKEYKKLKKRSRIIPEPENIQDLSEYESYLYASQVSEEGNQKPIKLLNALALSVPLLGKRILLEPALDRLSGEPECLLAFPPSWIAPAGGGGIRCFAATSEGHLLAIEVPSEQTIGGKEQAPVSKPWLMHQFTARSGGSEKILGLYRNKPRIGKPDLFLVLTKNGKTVANRYSLDYKNLPHYLNEIEDWMQVCPVTTNLEDDLLAISPPPEVPPGAQSAAWLDGTLFKANIHRKTGYLKGNAIHVLGDHLLVIRRDQNIQAYRVDGTAAPQRDWCWFSYRQPLCLCPLSGEGESPERFLLGFESGDLVPAVVMPARWDRDLWTDLQAKIADGFQLRTMENWLAWASEILNRSRAQISTSLGSGVLKLLFEFLLQQSNVDRKALGEWDHLFHPTLSMEDYVSLARTISEAIERWECEGNLRGANALLFIYQRLPYYYRDSADIALERHAHRSCHPLSPSQGDEDEDYRAYLHLWSRRSVTRSVLSLCGDLDPADRVAIHCEAWIYRSWLEYACQGESTEDAYLRAGLEEGVVYWIQNDKIYRMLPSNTEKQDVTPPRWESPSNCLTLTQEMKSPGMVGISEQAIIRLHVSEGGGFQETPTVTHLPDNVDLVRAADAGDGLLFIVVQPVDEPGRNAELWLWCTAQQQTIAKRMLPKDIPSELVTRVLKPGRCWLAASDLSNGRILVSRIVRRGEKLVFEKFFQRVVGGKVRSLAFVKRRETAAFDLLVGTTRGHLTALDFSGASPSLNPRWFHCNHSAVRHLDVLPTSDGYRVLSLTACGDIQVLDHWGHLWWQRRLYTTFRSGALIEADKTIYAAVLDVNGVFYLFRQHRAQNHKELVLEILQSDQPNRAFPHDEVKAFEKLKDHHTLKGSTLIKGLSIRARACLVKAIGEKLLDSLEHQTYRKVFEKMEDFFNLDDLETLAAIHYPENHHDERLWLFGRFLHILVRLQGTYNSGKISPLQTSDRIVQLLIANLRGLGRGLMTPIYLAKHKQEWMEIRPEIRHQPVVLSAVLRNFAHFEKDPLLTETLFPDMLCQAAWLGPAGYEALAMLAPTHRFRLCRDLAKAMKRIAGNAEDTRLTHLAATDIDGPGRICIALCRFLVDPSCDWLELIGIARQADLLLEQINQGDLPPLVTFLMRLAALFRVREDHQYQTIQMQLHTLYEMEALRMPDLPRGLGEWRNWLKKALGLFVQRRNTVISEHRAALQTTYRVSLMANQVTHLEEDIALLQMHLVREGMPGGKASVQLEVVEGMETFHRNLRDAWDWHGLPEEPIQWTGRLDGAGKITVRVVTEGAESYRHVLDWPVSVPRKLGGGSDFLARLPDVLDSFLSLTKAKTKGNFILAYEEKLGTAALTRSFLEDGHFRALDLDALLQHRGPGRREPGGFDGASLMRLLGCERTSQNKWYLPGRSYRALLVHNGVDTFSRLLAPRNQAILEAFQEELGDLNGVPVFLLLPLSVATELQARCTPLMCYVPLYAIDMGAGSELPGTLCSWLSTELALSASEVRNTLVSLDGNLRLLQAWMDHPRPAIEFLVKDDTVVELMGQELRHLSPMDYANLVVLAFCRVPLQKTEMRPGMLPAGSSEDQKDRVLVKGYFPEKDSAQDYPQELKWLFKLGRTDSRANRGRCRHMLRERGVLQIAEVDFVYLKQPYQLWLETHTNLQDSGRKMIDALLGQPFLSSISFRAMAAAREGLRLMGDVPVEGLALIEQLSHLFHPDEKVTDFKRLAELLAGQKVERLNESGLDPDSSLAKVLDEQIGLDNIFQVKGNPRQRHWLGIVTRTLTNDLQSLAKALAPWEKELTLALMGPGIAPQLSNPGNYCVISEHQLKELIFAPQPSVDFWLLVRNRFGLKHFSPFQVSNALSEYSSVFVGREQETETILHNIDGRSFLILGGRQIGKTSLLRHLFGKLLSRSNITPIFLDCQGITDVSGFLGKLVQACEEAELPVAERESPLDTIEATLRGLDNPILLINEVDGLALNQIPLLQRLRGLTEAGRCQFIMVGYHGAYGGTQDADHPLYHWTQVDKGEKAIILGALSEAAAGELVDKLETSRLSLRWENDQARTIGRGQLLDITYRIPLLLQGACDRLVKFLDEERRFVIRLDDVENPKGPGKNPAWDYLKKIKSTVLNKTVAGVQSPDQEQTPFESYWSRLVLAAVVHRRYLHPDPAPIDEKNLNRIPAPDLYFSVADVIDAVNDWLHRIDQVGLQQRIREKIDAGDYQRLLNFWTLTVILSPSAEHTETYYFQDHIYPIELVKYLARNGTDITSLITGLIGNINSILNV